MDDNQRAVIAALRQMGCSVQPLSMVGDGCPDIMVGYKGRNLLFEIKDGDKPPSCTKKTQKQEYWHRVWGGQVATVHSSDDAIMYVKAKCDDAILVVNSKQRGI